MPRSPPPQNPTASDQPPPLRRSKLPRPTTVLCLTHTQPFERAIKHFNADHKMPAAEEKELLKTTIQAPTSFNIQHWRFVILRDPDLRAKIRRDFGNDQAQMTDASTPNTTHERQTFMSETSKLYQPFELHGMKLANRVAMAPMTRARAGKERVPNGIMAEYYAQRSGAGLVISEATTVSPQANGWNESPGIYTDAMVQGWKLVTDAIHQAGSRMFLQLWHCGRASHPSFHDGEKHVAPSAIKINAEYIHTPKGKEDHETPRALETSELSGVVEEYRLAAQRGKDAGFDGVEIHSANGYLLDTFMQSKTNLREDAYGGSIENRYRLLDEVVSAVKTVWDSKRIGVRFSPNGAFNDMGSPDYREQFTYAAKQLDQHDLAYLHIMDGLAFGFHELGEPMTLAEFRKVFSGPLIGNCGYDKVSAESAVDNGQADMIAIGRPFISNPDLVDRYRNDWPLAPDAEVSDWHTPAGADGYTSFPAYSA